MSAHAQEVGSLAQSSGGSHGSGRARKLKAIHGEAQEAWVEGLDSLHRATDPRSLQMHSRETPWNNQHPPGSTHIHRRTNRTWAPARTAEHQSALNSRVPAPAAAWVCVEAGTLDRTSQPRKDKQGPPRVRRSPESSTSRTGSRVGAPGARGGPAGAWLTGTTSPSGKTNEFWKQMVAVDTQQRECASPPDADRRNRPERSISGPAHLPQQWH